MFAYLLTGGHPFEPWDCSSSQVQPMSRDVMNMLGETASAEIEHSPQDGPICQAIVRGTLSLPNLRFGKDDSQGESVSLLLSYESRASATDALPSISPRVDVKTACSRPDAADHGGGSASICLDVLKRAGIARALSTNRGLTVNACSAL